MFIDFIKVRNGFKVMLQRIQFYLIFILCMKLILHWLLYFGCFISIRISLKYFLFMLVISKSFWKGFKTSYLIIIMLSLSIVPSFPYHFIGTVLHLFAIESQVRWIISLLWISFYFLFRSSCFIISLLSMLLGFWISFFHIFHACEPSA